MKPKTLGECLILTAVYYQHEISSEIIDMYLSDLKSYEDEKCIMALNHYRKDPRNKSFPLPAQLIEIMNPKLEESVQIIGRIHEAVSKFGWPNSSEASEYIGPVGWEAIKKKGGWYFVCHHLGHTLDMNVFDAQIKKHIALSLKVEQHMLDNKSNRTALDARTTSDIQNNRPTVKR